MNTAERTRPPNLSSASKYSNRCEARPTACIWAAHWDSLRYEHESGHQPLLVFASLALPSFWYDVSVAALPLIIMSLFGGAIADRIQKKHIMFVCFLLFVSTALGIGIALNTGTISPARSGSWSVLLATSFIQSCLMGMLIPAQSAIVAEVVKREQLLNAIALSTLGMNVLA